MRAFCGMRSEKGAEEACAAAERERAELQKCTDDTVKEKAEKMKREGRGAAQGAGCRGEAPGCT